MTDVIRLTMKVNSLASPDTFGLSFPDEAVLIFRIGTDQDGQVSWGIKFRPPRFVASPSNIPQGLRHPQVKLSAIPRPLPVA